jgi:hypothetical protein
MCRTFVEFDREQVDAPDVAEQDHLVEPVPPEAL